MPNFEQCKEQFLLARNSQNMQELAIWSTELLKTNENMSWVWGNRANALQALGHPLDAVLNYDRAIAVEKRDDQLAVHHSNKGAAYFDMLNVDKALESLRLSIAINPLPQAYLTLGNVFKYQSNLDAALECYQKSITLDPEYADGHLVYGMSLLKAGRLKEGWKEYEWRWKTNQLPPRKLRIPVWNGEDLTNRTIFVYGEQGLGDMIQFARYARMLTYRFKNVKVILEVRQPVKKLLEMMPDVYAVMNIGEQVPVCDYSISLMSLVGDQTPDIEHILPARYEFPLKKADVERWADKFSQFPALEGFKVGVCWAGMSRAHQPLAAAVDEIRSTTLEEFAPIGRVPGVKLISLQKGPPAEQLKNCPSGITIGDYTEDMYDFYETACAIENCDLVVSVDTAVLHVAASLGKPTWLVSRWDGCWRWFGDRPDSPWYPSLRQYVQHRPHDWGGVIKEVVADLTKLLESKNQT